MKRNPWTTTEEKTLRLLIAQGYGGTRLAYRLAKESGGPRRTLAAVQARANRLGLSVPKPPEWTRQELDEVASALSQGVSYEDLPDWMASAGFPRRTRVAYSVKAAKEARAQGRGRMACAVDERVAMRKRVTELELAVATLAATVASLQGGAA